MKSEEIYTIRIRCKKYVQRYLLLNFGCRTKAHPYLVDVSKDKELSSFLRRAVKRPCLTRDKWLQTFEGKKRNCEVEIRVGTDLFNRYGYTLTATDETKLNSLLERRCNAMLLQFLSFQYVLTADLTVAIQEFYEQYGFSERSWPSSSISKIWQRNKSKLNIFDLKEEFNAFFTNIFMCKLSHEKDNLQTTLETCIS